MTQEEAKARILALRAEIRHHAELYYQKDAPEISDFEYDALFRELEELEAAHPECDDPASPTHRVGGAVLDKFEKTGAWRLPVMDKEGKYLGFVSKSRILSEYRRELKEISQD